MGGLERMAGFFLLMLVVGGLLFAYIVTRPVQTCSWDTRPTSQGQVTEKTCMVR